MKHSISVFGVIAPAPRYTWMAAAIFAAILSVPVYAILILLSWLI